MLAACPQAYNSTGVKNFSGTSEAHFSKDKRRSLQSTPFNTAANTIWNATGLRIGNNYQGQALTTLSEVGFTGKNDYANGFYQVTTFGMF